MALAIGIVLTLLVVGGVIFAYMRMNSRVKAFTFTRYDKSELDQIKNTQDLLPFKGIARNRIDLGNHRYVAYVKVEPFNYIIRSEEGKDSFAIRLRRAFNSIPFRTVMYIHTRKMVNNDMLARLSKTIDETVSAHPDSRLTLTSTSSASVRSTSRTSRPVLSARYPTTTWSSHGSLAQTSLGYPTRSWTTVQTRSFNVASPWWSRHSRTAASLPAT